MVRTFTQIPRLLAGLAILSLPCTALPAGDPFGLDPELQRQARQGDPRAQTRLAGRYADGVGVPQNYARAIDWYRRAAGQGYAPAREALAALGVPPVAAEPDPVDDAAASQPARPRRDGHTVNINILTGGSAGYSRGRGYDGYYVITRPRRHRKLPGHPGHGKPVPLPGNRSGSHARSSGRGVTAIPPGR